MEQVLLTLDAAKKNGKSYVLESDSPIAKMTFRLRGKTLIIDHTEINKEFQGKGLGKQLLMKLVSMAREKNYKIIPLCPYANALFKKNPDLADVIKGERDLFRSSIRLTHILPVILI